MQKYQFEKIFKTMKKEYGEIKEGHEDPYYQIMFCMEGNVLKVRRKNPASNTYRMKEAVALVLWDIWNRLHEDKTDIDDFRDENNEKLEHALLMAFDPFTNPDVQAVLDQQFEGYDLHEYYTYPVRALLRIRKSIDIWEEALGSDGYFKMYERDFGKLFKEDDTEMNFIVMYRGIPLSILDEMDQSA